MSAALWICAISAVLIFGIMLHSVATFRSGPTRMRHHALIEVGWALIPILIVVAAALPSLQGSNEPAIVIAAID